jgi:hypothetical protein
MCTRTQSERPHGLTGAGEQAKGTTERTASSSSGGPRPFDFACLFWWRPQHRTKKRVFTRTIRMSRSCTYFWIGSSMELKFPQRPPWRNFERNSSRPPPTLPSIYVLVQSAAARCAGTRELRKEYQTNWYFSNGTQMHLVAVFGSSCLREIFIFVDYYRSRNFGDIITIWSDQMTFRPLAIITASNKALNQCGRRVFFFFFWNHLIVTWCHRTAFYWVSDILFTCCELFQIINEFECWDLICCYS